MGKRARFTWPRGDLGEQPTSVARAVVQFGLLGLAVLLIVVVLGIFAITRVGNEEATRDAQRVTHVVGAGIVQPELRDSLFYGSPQAITKLDQVVGRRVLLPPVVRVKIWTLSGRIIYSDEHRLIGSTYKLGEDELNALRNGRTDAEISDLTAPENRFERSEGKLLEVYLPVTMPGGRRVLFETYQNYDAIVSSGRRVWGYFIPVILIALVVLALAQVPLAWRMARRLRSSQLERERLFHQAINASDAERRRIASDLHDGVVQDLAGVSYLMSAAANSASDLGDRGLSNELDESSSRLRRIMRQMRSLLVEIYPPSLHTAGLESVLADLTAPLVAKGTEVGIASPPGLRLTEADEALFFRVAQEAVRNIERYADARSVRIEITAKNGSRSLAVIDDGRGFSAGHWKTRIDDGHLGLTLLRQFVAEQGASLDIESEPRKGTTITVISASTT